MIGAIKRRWKSKKAKVLHKGNDLSSSSDSCPTSRGFVDGPEDFDKMIKPPSPRQVHPVLDKGDIKLGQFHNLHHLLQQNNGNNSNSNQLPHNHHHNSYVLQQPPSTANKKSSTLPASNDVDDKNGSQDACHFIRVNSGRIELVSKDSWKTSSADQSTCRGGVVVVGGNNALFNNSTSSATDRFLNRHMKNDVRHSWCGSAIRKNSDVPQSQQQNQAKRLTEDQTSVGFRGGLTSNNNNNRIYPQEDIPVEGQHYHRNQPPLKNNDDARETTVSGETPSNEPTSEQKEPLEDTVEYNSGQGLLSPLRERLAAIEQLTTNLQSWQTTEKTEYEKCVSDLANQVSRAVALQQLMKSEVEKLQQRVVDLENHNKAMATMIIPTLMKLHDSTLGINEAPQLKSIEPAPSSIDSDDKRMTKSDIQEREVGSSSRTSSPRRYLVQCSSSEEIKSTGITSSTFLENSCSNNEPSSCSSAGSPTHFIATVTTTSPSSSRNGNSQIKTISYDQPTTDFSGEPSTFTQSPIVSRKIDGKTSSDSLPQSQQSTPHPLPTSLRSPVKAPRMSKMVQDSVRAQQKCSSRGTSSGNVSRSSSASLSRSNSINRAVISLIENETCLSSSPTKVDSQIMSSSDPKNSLELSTSSTSTTSSSGRPVAIISSNNDNNNEEASPRPTRSNAHNSRQTVTSSGIPRMASPARNKIQTSTPKPQRKNQPNSDRSCSPQRTSRLPVRKATSFATNSNSPSSTVQPGSDKSSSSTSRHPAATSKSLPANSNMGTAFQRMSQSGQHTNSSKSKSTFGFSGSPKKNPHQENNSTNNSAVNSSRNTSVGVPSKMKTFPSQATTTPTNLPECSSQPTSGPNSSVATTRPIKLASSSAVGITKGNGKDEGYSTMSSEAFAEQEHHHHSNLLPQTDSLERPSRQQKTGVLTTLTKLSTFSGKSVNAKNTSATVDSSTNTLPSSKTCTSSSNNNKTQCSALSSCASSEPISGVNRNSIHKSNTINTFRATSQEQRRNYGGCESVCDADVDDDDEDEEDDYAELKIHLKNNYSSTGNNGNSHDMMMTVASTSSHNSSSRSSARQFKSLPDSSSSCNSSPSKGGNVVGTGSSTTSSTSKSPKKNCYKDRITTTRMMDGNIVKIVRGSPYSIRLGDESGDDMEDEEDPSSSTILWEDSDDSDILFLPLEVTESARSSRSTLVPLPQSSGESRSYYSSWGRTTSGVATATTCSTLEKGGSNGSVNSGFGNYGGTYSRKAYPLRRTKGEVTVDVLLVNGNATCIGGGGNNSGSNISSLRRTNLGCGRGDTEGDENNEDTMVLGMNEHLSLENNHNNDDNQETDEMEERALIEKWMQLEEVRNEQVHGGEQWAWDWDGVERTYTRVLRNVHRGIIRSPLGLEMENDDDVDDIDVDLILEQSTLGPETDLVTVEERNAINESVKAEIHMQIDSSTWTKSKTKKKIGDNGPRSNSLGASPEKVKKSREGVNEAETSTLIGSPENGRVEVRSLIKSSAEEDGLESDPKKSHNAVLSINLDENGMVVTNGDTANGPEGDDTSTAPELEEDPAPVIEFTPEFYQLTNYGSNLSISDNESTSSPTQNQRVSNDNSPGNGSRSSPKKKRITRRSKSQSNSKDETKEGENKQSSSSCLDPSQMMKTDDKISQTDFSCSSLENMSSVSSELSAECRNCLEIIKKLVGQGETDMDETEAELEEGETHAKSDTKPNGATHSEKKGRLGGGLNVDGGSYATTWISVPKGLPTAEVDRILEILSSSESEGVLSPSK